MDTLAHIIGGLSTLIISVLIWLFLGEPHGWSANKEWILNRIIAVLIGVMGIYLILYPFVDMSQK